MAVCVERMQPERDGTRHGTLRMMFEPMRGIKADLVKEGRHGVWRWLLQPVSILEFGVQT